MTPLLRVLLQAALYTGLARAIDHGTHNKQRVRRYLIGLLLLWGAASFLVVAISILLAAIFFALAGFDTLLKPTFITAAITAAIALLLGWQGWSQFKT